MKKRTMYETPTMTVVKLQHQPQLLAGSVDATINATIDGTPWTEETILGSRSLEEELLLP